jgi:hypothetical protein
MVLLTTNSFLGHSFFHHLGSTHPQLEANDKDRLYGFAKASPLERCFLV